VNIADIQESPIVTFLKGEAEEGVYLLWGLVGLGDAAEGHIRLYLSGAPLKLSELSYLDIDANDILDIDQSDSLGQARVLIRHGAILKPGGPHSIEELLGGELIEKSPGYEMRLSKPYLCR